MKDKKNVLTYLSYILFLLCTLIYLAAYMGIFEKLNIVLSASGIAFVAVVLFMIAFACRMAAKIFHAKKKLDRLSYLSTDRKRYEYVIETILIILLFAAALAARALLKYIGVFSDNTDIFEYGFLFNNIIYIAGSLFMFFSIRLTAGRLACLLGAAVMLFWPAGFASAYSDSYDGLITNMVLWGLFLCFILFFRLCTGKKKNKSSVYICAILLGIVSNVVLIAAEYAFLFLILIFAFLLFKYIKPALLYVLFSLPALVLKIYGIVMKVLSGNTEEFYDLLDFNITVSDIEVFRFSSRFFDLNILFYITMFIFAFICVIILFKKPKKPVQICMLYAVLASFLGKEYFIYTISVYIFLAAYMIQFMYSHMVKRRCIKYGTEHKKMKKARASRAKSKAAATEEHVDRPDAEHDSGEPDTGYISGPDAEHDSEPDADITYILPIMTTENNYMVNTRNDYTVDSDEEIIEMLEKRRNRLTKKHNTDDQSSV